MEQPKVASLDLNDPKNIQVQVWVDPTLLIGQRISAPAGDPDTWTIGQLKQLALDAARSKIPSR